MEGDTGADPLQNRAVERVRIVAPPHATVMGASGAGLSLSLSLSLSLALSLTLLSLSLSRSPPLPLPLPLFLPPTLYDGDEWRCLVGAGSTVAGRSICIWQCAAAWKVGRRDVLLSLCFQLSTHEAAVVVDSLCPSCLEVNRM